MSIETAPINNPDPSVTPPPQTSANGTSFPDEPVNEFPIVGIGASAGGLAAFEHLFKALPPDTGMAFVVVQHLSPPHKSILPEILHRFTAMPVAQVKDEVEVSPNHVYVIPPGSDLALKNGRLKLLDPEITRGYRLPVDFFFRTLAQDQGARAIGIVLSGTGSDGSQGLKNIKAEGGLTIAQEPDTAEYSDMPRNAIATKDVDYILPPEKIGEVILKYIHHRVLSGYKRGVSDFEIPLGGLQKLYFLLRSKTGHDFSLYKQNTIQRRIERRMKITLVKDLEEYIQLLQNRPEEMEALFQEMLINVTYFFREPEAFQALIDNAIRPLILQKHAAHAPIRVWVAGCSSGEEAYSVAIAIQEQLEILKVECKVQIYATDLDKDAIAAARKGFYSDGSLENVSVERLQRFFHLEDERYHVKKNIRDMVVFSNQNLISDPSFSKIDLLCCRNLLIYLEHELQNQLLPQFHYSLNPDGILFLGNSESIGGFSELFAVIDRKYKLFKRKEVNTRRPLTPKASHPLPKNKPAEPGSQLNRSMPGGLQEWAEKVLLGFHTPACVIIDPNHNILFINGRTGKYLEPVPGETNNNLIRMAREGLKTELATAIHAAIDHQEVVRREGVRVKTNGDFQSINLTIRPIQGPPGFGGLIMVVFEEAQTIAPDLSPKTANNEPMNREVMKLRNELNEKDEYLHTIINELEDTNQDLKFANEELQSANEEMQSTNEELETSKEELQSINEELGTINTELQYKNEELSGANNDIYNLLTSIDIGAIFLNLDLQIRRFTPAVNRIYNLVPADIGRPLAHFVSNLNYDRLMEDTKQVLRTLIPKVVEAQSKDGLWYLINIRPYRTLENVIDGAVITFVDISEQKRGDELRRMGTILRDSNDAVTVQDFNGNILAWNRGASQLYGWSESEALIMNSVELIPENKQIEVEALYRRLSAGENIHSFETQRVTRDGRILDIWMTLTPLVNDANRPVAIATTERDITDRKRAGQNYLFEIRGLKALTFWYQSHLESAEKNSLAETACKILVQHAGYASAWIGKLEPGESKTVRTIAQAGFEERDSRLFIEFTQASVASALNSRMPVVFRDRSTDRQQNDLQIGASIHPNGSFLSLPILYQKDPVGILVVFAPEPDAFSDMEIRNLFVFSSNFGQVIGLDWKSSQRK